MATTTSNMVTRSPEVRTAHWQLLIRADQLSHDAATTGDVCDQVTGTPLVSAFNDFKGRARPMAVTIRKGRARRPGFQGRARAH